MTSPTDASTIEDRRDRSCGRRPGRRVAAVTGAVAGLTGLLATGAAPAPAGASPAGAAPAAASASVAAGRRAAPAQDCTRPTDGRIVHVVDMLVPATTIDHGDVQLWYSPACRSVAAVAIAQHQTCTPDVHIKAFVVHNGVVTGSGTCQSGRKAATPWVNDAGIQQAAKGLIALSTGHVYSTGTTPAY